MDDRSIILSFASAPARHQVAVVLLQVNKKRARPRPRASGFGAKATRRQTCLALMLKGRQEMEEKGI
jgi:hypothetical protein